MSFVTTVTSAEQVVGQVVGAACEVGADLSMVGFVPVVGQGIDHEADVVGVERLDHRAPADLIDVPQSQRCDLEQAGDQAPLGVIHRSEGSGRV